MNQELKEKIARNAASTWCRCFKCDGELREMNSKCNKDTLHTCLAWYTGYRTALLALDEDRVSDTDTLKTIKQLADAMYNAAQNLTTDTSRLHKAMKDYHQFIIQHNI